MYCNWKLSEREFCDAFQVSQIKSIPFQRNKVFHIMFDISQLRLLAKTSNSGLHEVENCQNLQKVNTAFEYSSGERWKSACCLAAWLPQQPRCGDQDLSQLKAASKLARVKKHSFLL